MTRLIVYLSGATLGVMLICLNLALGLPFPDSDELLYIGTPRTDNTASLYIHDLRTNTIHPLINNLIGWGLDASWSPDGQRIAYTSFQQSIVKRDIYIVDVLTGDIVQITGGLGDYNSPAWSPDGHFLTYQANFDNATWNVYIHDLETDEVRVIYASSIRDARPAWSPDGETIALETVDITGITLILLRDIRSDAVVRLIPQWYDNFAPDWSPDGEKIAFVLQSGSSYDIGVINRDGSNLKTLVRDPANDLEPAWSPDGKKIAFNTRRSQDSFYLHIYIADAVSGKSHRVTSGKIGFVQPDWRP